MNIGTTTKCKTEFYTSEMKNYDKCRYLQCQQKISKLDIMLF